MTGLEAAQPAIERFLTILSKALDLDLAVIDSEYHLVASTGAYAQTKGQSVHAPFVEEVLSSGNVLVFEPGHMSSCTGCRFQDNCPATAEILNSISGQHAAHLGVLALTSFTNEGRCRLTQHWEDFLDILNEASRLISSLVGSGLEISGPGAYKRAIRSWGSHISFDDIKGNSRAMLDLKETARRISRSSSNVLLIGETGTGKELLARAIHHESGRRDGPFVAINCAGIPDSLLESELFGYEQGAFTGARKSGKPGRFEIAQGGTLFLDEIGDMPLHLQSKLLRVLQERAIERVGGTTLVPVDVRLMAATNRNLEAMVEEGSFRRDLFYRINVIPLGLPPLRERPGDTKELAMFFLEKYQHIATSRLVGFTSESMDLLQRYDWPGNLRELENAVEFAVNMETTSLIRRESLPPKIREGNAREDRSLKLRVMECERNAITEALERYGWDLDGKTRAAKHLGIGIRTLYRKMKEVQLT